MATIIVFSEKEEAAWQDWLSARPAIIRTLAAKYPPTKLYRLTTSPHRCTIHSYSEDGTVTVDITGGYNRVLFGRKVFGINPDHLVECDLPAEGEDLGDTAEEAGYNDEDIKNILIPKLRSAQS